MGIFNKQKRTEYHVITCNHPFMIDAGMNSFTLPELINWWNFKDGRGKYINREFFPKPSQDQDENESIGLAELIDPTPRYTGSYEFNAWRYEKFNAGNYIKYAILTDKTKDADTWEYYNNNPNISDSDKDPFTIGDLNLNSYTGKTFDRITRELEDFPALSEGITDDYPVVVSNLIAMNDFYNIRGFEDTEQDNASRKFLNDIRRSKNSGYISWSGVVPLFLNIFEGGQKCVTNEDFTFKLYLFDRKKPLDNTKSQAFPDITLATYAIGPDGTNQKGKQDGDSFAITDDAPDKKVGGKLRTTFRPYDGTFSAGSEQIYGIVTSDIIPATVFPEDMVQWAEDMDIEEYLKDAVNNPHIQIGSGVAIPIDMQNSNPFQWTPNYANPKGCRADSKEKVTVKVFNMSPREFTRGETVLLTDRYSLWWIDPIASGAEPPLPLEKTVSQWQFTYHMTNQDYFFRFADPTAEENDNNTINSQEDGIDGGYNLNPKVVTCMEAEQALSRKYLAARDEATYLEKYGKDVTDTDSIEEKDAGKAWPGYAQITNWDFMGTHLAGLREKNDGENMGNALVLTQTDKNHRGEFLQEFNNYGVQGVGRFTAPFFGCTFPNGYLGGDETSKYVNLNSAVREVNNNFTGKGFYVSGHDIDQNQAFFNQAKYGDDEALKVFDPTHPHNNISTNISPYYFFELIYEDQEVQDEPHCNIFSSKEDFFHLPADIGVNGSFNAEYGGPILSLNKVQEYITSSKISDWASPTKVYENFHDFWLDSGSFQWLFNIVDSETKQKTYNPDNSTFDIRPRNPNRVEFRPLKDSVVAQFDPPQVQIFGEKPSGDDPDKRTAQLLNPYPAKALVAQGFNNYNIRDGEPANGSIGISNYGPRVNPETGELIDGPTPLWGKKTKLRLLANDGPRYTKFELSLENNPIIAEGSSRAGLIFSLNPTEAPSHADDPDAIKEVKANSAQSDIAFEVGPDGALDNGLIMPFKYNPWYTEGPGLHLEWNKLNDDAWYATLDAIYPNFITNNQYGATDNNKQRGAYGVIGAVCTSEMQAGVQFKTVNILGQPHAFLSNVFYPSWGARQDLTYSDPNTTALFVKIYEAWPRDQTIFDARFYAVHHFNDGNRLQPQEVRVPPLDFIIRRPWELGYQFGEIFTYGERNPLTQQLIRPDETLDFTFTYSNGTQQVSEVQVQTYVNTEGVITTPFPASGIPVVHDKTVTNVDTKIPSIFSNGTVNLKVTSEDRRPDRETFTIESLSDSESTAAAKRPISIYQEGAYITETDQFGKKGDAKACNYVIDGDIVKDLGRYIEDEFSGKDDYDFDKYLEKYEKYTPLVPTSLWNVDPNRRARLLPWIYRKHDIGFGYKFMGLMFNPGFIKFEDSDGNTLIQPEDTLHDIVEAQSTKNIIVAESGAGYKVGNIFTVTGGTGFDVQMRISETGVDGSVAELQWISEEESVAGNQVDRPLVGYGFLPTDFLSGEATGITPETTSNLKITPVGNSNRSFKAYFVAGYTNYEEFIDRKPQVVTEVKDAYRISAPNNKDGESGSVSWRDSQDVAIIQLGAQALVLGDGVSFVATPGGLNNTDHIVGTNIRSINLNYDREKSNPNVLKGVYSKYDMFFHFHCDTNHQWIESDGQPLTFENQIDMKIFPF